MVSTGLDVPPKVSNFNDIKFTTTIDDTLSIYVSLYAHFTLFTFGILYFEHFIYASAIYAYCLSILLIMGFIGLWIQKCGDLMWYFYLETTKGNQNNFCSAHMNPKLAIYDRCLCVQY